MLENKLSALGFGFLIPIFFIHVGMGFDLRNVAGPAQLIFTGQLLLLALAVKILPALLFLFRGLSVGMAVSVGLVLSTRLSLIVAAAAIGAAEGLISVETKDAVVLLAVLTCLLGPVLSKAGLKRAVPPVVSQKG